jgi:chemosensory pili system protein ChpC
MADKSAIRCMQLPLTELQLLIPNSAVAEIIGYAEPEVPGPEGDWYDGKISWRGVSVPVISFERMCDRDAVEPGPRSRIAVIYNLDGDEELPYYGIILQDIPRAYLAEEERMVDAILGNETSKYLATRADPLLEGLWIPDMDAIIASIRERVLH